MPYSTTKSNWFRVPGQSEVYRAIAVAWGGLFRITVHSFDGKWKYRYSNLILDNDEVVSEELFDDFQGAMKASVKTLCEIAGEVKTLDAADFAKIYDERE